VAVLVDGTPRTATEREEKEILTPAGGLAGRLDGRGWWKEWEMALKGW
jgi:hypothetical protein